MGGKKKRQSDTNQWGGEPPGAGTAHISQAQGRKRFAKQAAAGNKTTKK